MELHLSDEQVDLLKMVLTDHLSDLRMEITSTEDYDLRQALKRNEQMITEVLAKLGEHLRVGNDLRRIA